MNYSLAFIQQCCNAKFVASILVAFSLLAISNSRLAYATNYFTWGVESNFTSYSTSAVIYKGGSSRDCTVAHTGSCSMKLQVIGNDSGNQQMGADLISQKTFPFNIVGGPALYYRWWMRIMPGFSWGTGTRKTKSSRLLGGVYSRGYTGYVTRDRFLVAECDAAAPNGCLDAQGTPNSSDSLIGITYDIRTMADGLWHEYIVMVKPNSTSTSMDAQLKVWVDNVKVGEYLNWRLSTVANNPHIEAWGSWMVYPYFQLNGTVSDGGTIYVDDFSTDDVYNSLIVGFPTPGNLRVQ